jgi:propionate catabolism operon transcriptional regulator
MRSPRARPGWDSARWKARLRLPPDRGALPLLREALTRATKVTSTETTVLLTGERGTGKELIAQAIHHASPRVDGPFADQWRGPP